jgi:branched-chain amino acid transport system permease protein
LSGRAGEALRRRSWLALPAAMVVAAFIPLFATNPYDIHVMNSVLIFSILALGLQFITGIAGQFSVGHVAFYGIAAYTTGYFTTEHGWPVLAGMVAGVLMASVFGALMAPITRLRGNYMAMATLAFLGIVHLFLQNEHDLTGGTSGMGGIPAPSLFGTQLADDGNFYLLCLVVLGITFAMLQRMSGESRFGRALAMMRQDGDAAAAMGVNTTELKIKAFIVSAAVAGVAGVLFAHQTNYVHPNDITLTLAILVLTMIVVGGLGSLTGAIVGAALLTLATEYLRFLEDWRLILYGVLVVAIMIYMPEGLVGGARRLWRFARSRRSKARFGGAEAHATGD